MKKVEQLAVNAKVDEIFTKALIEYNNCEINSKRLRYCQACVYTTPNFYLLRSYRTFVAVIERNTDTLVDGLRYMYGYTATSAQHISKFAHDYGAGKRGCENRLTWRDITLHVSRQKPK